MLEGWERGLAVTETQWSCSGGTDILDTPRHLPCHLGAVCSLVGQLEFFSVLS